jgi:asparagine synthase (glutamine-hydrolysing)
MREDLVNRECAAKQHRRDAAPQRLVSRGASIHLERGPDGRVGATGDLSASFGHRLGQGDASDGIYAGWHWDGTHLALSNDAYGFYPLFVWIASTSCVLATELTELLALGAPRTLDYDALSVFLRVGFFVGDDTPFRAIRAVPSNATIEWTAAGPHVVERRKVVKASILTRDAAIDGFIELVRHSVARRLPAGAYEMPLSGGRDSRHVLLALNEAGAPPAACVTVAHYPPRSNDDIRVASRLCEQLGISHVVVPQYQDRIAAEREKNARTHFLSYEHAQFVALADYLRAVTQETYDGIAGDVLSQSSYLSPDAYARFLTGPAAAAEYVLDGYGEAVSDTALVHVLSRPLMREVPRERAIARLAQEIASHLDAPNPVASFFFWNRTRREIALSPYGVLRGVTVHAPYLDRALFDLLASLPAALVMDRRLHTDAVARAYPHVADVPYAARRRELSPSAQRRLALGLTRTVLASPALFRVGTLLPRLLAAVVDGDPARLWHTQVTTYLGQLNGLASLCPSRRSKADRPRGFG